MNQSLRRMEYAVRGEIVARAAEYEQRLRDGKGGELPFKSMVWANIGNPQQVGNPAVTFPRQVLALTAYPALAEGPAAAAFPADAVARARKYLDEVGSTGAYTGSQGMRTVREEVAAFIAARDGHPADPDDVFLTDGASPGAKSVVQMAVRGPADGIMVPVPQYPLYSASITACNGSMVGYYLDESRGWSTSGDELQRAYDEAAAGGVAPRVLVVINPGNPTGQCLSEEAVRGVVEFARRNNVLLLADEVYQANIYSSDTQFTSFKKAVRDLGADDVQLVSLHSVSKGVLGECGRRGGYFETTNIDAGVKAQMLKLASVSLCSNVDGQIMTGLMVNPPREGDESHALYRSEVDAQLASLKRRAAAVAGALNGMEGVSCQPVEGSMYAFPTVTLPPRAVEAAAAAGKAPDLHYCLELLARTGIVTVPGSGFKQRPGTFHLRTTILPLEDQIESYVRLMSEFHREFMDAHR